MDPGMAFGSGTHPTTQLCLVLLESYLEENPGQVILDIGCGSGILAITGGKLGAEYVLGFDNDPATITVAEANAKMNRVDDSIEFQHGSVDEIKRGQYKINAAPLVVANIIAPILTKLLEGGMDELVHPGGSLILSGILEEQLPGICDLLEEKNLEISDKRQIGNWIALRADKLSR
jgi:ribosomal protein L11 methyltransferase